MKEIETIDKLQGLCERKITEESERVLGKQLGYLSSVTIFLR